MEKKEEKYPKPCQMGTHLIVLSESYHNQLFLFISIKCDCSGKACQACQKLSNDYYLLSVVIMKYCIKLPSHVQLKEVSRYYWITEANPAVSHSTSYMLTI